MSNMAANNFLKKNKPHKNERRERGLVEFNPK